MRNNVLIAVLMTIVLGHAVQAEAQLSVEESVAQAILDMTTTERRNLWWQPCGERFRGRDARAEEYAREIATALVEAAGDDLDPWWMAAQLMQESGMNPCAFSSNEFAVLQRELGRRPTQRDILRLLSSSTARRERGIRGMDGGLAQFRWPGAVARRVGIERPEQLLDPALSLRAFAAALRIYRTHCEEHPTFSGTDTVPIRNTDRTRVVPWRFSCADTYWAIHNSGSVHVRRRYILNVQRRYQAGPERWKAVYERQRSTVDQPTG